MTEQNIRGNRGEWSEIYVFFKLLADGKLFAADENLNKLTNIFYPIIKIIRNEVNGKWEYYRNSSIKIVEASTQKLINKIPIAKFNKNAEDLLNGIKGSSSRSFSIPATERFMNSIKCQTLKANPQEKKDITIMVHDIRTGLNPTLGFSIKSQLGGASTLLNANKASTNFVYLIENLDLNREQIESINLIRGRSKIKNRLENLTEKGAKLKFVKIEKESLELNLKLIDSRLPEIIATILLIYFTTKYNTFEDLIKKVKQINPCGFNLDASHPFYEYKIKNLLTDIALGMTPASIWDGRYDATGGIIIVREDGEVLCYHIYNRNEFQDYLIKNTKLDTPSSSRHEYGEIYQEDGLLYFKLNLQIRFIK
ncbi:MAG: HpaII family restriction endonuclease [Candidatus Lokiarchaeota archaeon]|nr:HpaII family restriction endonuclease [Candidatus Lokiarchaeota archaeon]MBD3340959.1 HpaII family restriction endonuclease [Candidatus Lokiarchaeota archaeon]